MDSTSRLMYVCLIETFCLYAFVPGRLAAVGPVVVVFVPATARPFSWLARPGPARLKID